MKLDKITLGNAAKKISAGEELNKIKETSEKDYEIVYVPYDQLECNKLNDFPITKIEDLANDIEKFSYLNPLSIKFNDGSQTKKYRILGGERRYNAIGLILKRSPKKFSELFKNGIPCIIDKSDLSPLQEEIRITLLNKTRDDLPKDFWIKKTKRLHELYEQEGVKESKIVEQIAENLNVGKRQVQRYSTISKNEDNILPEIRQAFNDSKISLENLASISSLDKETQQSLVNLLKEKDKISKSEINVAKAQTEELQKKLAEKKKELDKLEEKNKQLENTIYESEQKVKDFKEYEKKMQEELQKVKKETLNNKENPKVKELEEQLKELEQKQKIAEQEKQKAYESLNKVTKQIEKLEAKPQIVELTEEEQKKLYEKYEIEHLENELSKKLNEYLMKAKKYEEHYKESISNEEILNRMRKLL